MVVRVKLVESGSMVSVGVIHGSSSHRCGLDWFVVVSVVVFAVVAD